MPFRSRNSGSTSENRMMLLNKKKYNEDNNIQVLKKIPGKEVIKKKHFIERLSQRALHSFDVSSTTCEHQ